MVKQPNNAMERNMEKGVPIRSVSRSISALKAINEAGSLTMMEIARAARVPYPTACRIVQTLMFEGLIEQEPSRKRYRPTALVQMLAQGFQHRDHLVQTARPHIASLTRDVGWPISIAIRVGRRMMLRDSTHADTSLTFENYYPGFTLPLVDSASGKLALAYAADEERDMIISWMHEVPEVELDYLKSALSSLNVQKIREDGYALQGRNHYNKTPGKTSSIAVPIFNNGEFEAAMTMVFFVNAMKLDQAVERYMDQLKNCAAAISADLSKISAERK
jgi:IclR family mhp operon transcriptional activator